MQSDHREPPRVDEPPRADEPHGRASDVVVELVRHASAGQRGRWKGGPDRDRPLDERGREQARLLAADVAHSHVAGTDAPAIPPVGVIVSSPLARCVQTVQPLAAALGLDVTTHEALEELSEVPITEGGSAWVNAAWLGARALGLVDRLVAETDGRRIVLCSHGDVVPALLATLVGRDGLALHDVRCRKAGRYRLRFSDGRLVAAQQVPPPDDQPGERTR